MAEIPPPPVIRDDVEMNIRDEGAAGKPSISAADVEAAVAAAAAATKLPDENGKAPPSLMSLDEPDENWFLQLKTNEEGFLVSKSFADGKSFENPPIRKEETPEKNKEPAKRGDSGLLVMFEIEGHAYRCYLCDVKTQTKHALDQHVEGKRHTNKVKVAGGTSMFEPGTWNPEELPPLPKPEPEFDAQIRKRKREEAKGEFRCEVCQIDFSSKIPFEGHMEGQQHATKIRRLNEDPNDPNATEPETDPFACELCNVKCGTQEYLDDHLAGKRHYLKIHKPEPTEVLPDMSMKCELCDIVVVGENHFTAHVKGKRHAARQRAMGKGVEKMKLVTCEDCDVMVPTEELYEIHLTRNSHAKKLAELAEFYKAEALKAAEAAEAALAEAAALEAAENGENGDTEEKGGESMES